MSNLNVQQWISSAMSVLQSHRSDINNSVTSVSLNGSQIVATTHSGATQAITLPDAANPLSADSGIAPEAMAAL